MTEKIFFKKIAYFDEQAATDLLLEKNGGFSEKTSNKIKEFSDGFKGETELSTPKLFNLLKFNLSGNAKGELSNLAQTQIKSSILTDFLQLVSKDNLNFFNEDCSIKITDDSAAFIRSAGSFLKIFKNDPNISQDLTNILETVDLAKFEKILDHANGYYPVIGKTQDSEQLIIRFNFAGIRNNYKLIDLTKMNLRIIGIEVGNTNSLDISFGNELNSSEEQNDEASLKNLYVMQSPIDDSYEESTVNMKYKIIDAIIAGVE